MYEKMPIIEPYGGVTLKEGGSGAVRSDQPRRAQRTPSELRFRRRLGGAAGAFAGGRALAAARPSQAALSYSGCPTYPAPQGALQGAARLGDPSGLLEGGGASRHFTVHAADVFFTRRRTPRTWSHARSQSVSTV